MNALFVPGLSADLRPVIDTLSCSNSLLVVSWRLEVVLYTNTPYPQMCCSPTDLKTEQTILLHNLHKKNTLQYLVTNAKHTIIPYRLKTSHR